MYAAVNIFTILFLISKINFGRGDYLPSCVYDACERITDPEYLITSCCRQMDPLIKIINDCKGDSPTISNCKQAKCINDHYGVLTDGEVDLRKVEQAIIALNARHPDQIPLNALLRKYCVRGNYTCFPSEDPYCRNWKFVNCAFFASRLACPLTDSDCDCEDIAEDVLTCKPFQRRYVRELNKGCSSCSASPSREKIEKKDYLERMETPLRYITYY